MSVTLEAAGSEILPAAARTGASSEQISVRDGLAVYRSGEGEPLLLMPYPHSYTIKPTAEGPLAKMLVQLGRQVITFDPPGAYLSTRSARVDMPEMLGCAEEALAVAGVAPSVSLDVVGHSMGGLCALAFAIERPERVKRLVLVATVSGGRAAMRYRGMPLNFSPVDPRFWRFIVYGIRLRLGRTSLAEHKRILRIVNQASYRDKSKVPEIEIEPGDEQRPSPVRDRWPEAALKIDYSERLGLVRARALICVGRYDPQAPFGCSKELVRGIQGARLSLFQYSGHSPFVEEPERFDAVLRRFLA